MHLKQLLNKVDVISVHGNQDIKLNNIEFNSKKISHKHNRLKFSSIVLQKTLKNKKNILYYGVSINSKNIKPKNLFVAIKGKNRERSEPYFYYRLNDSLTNDISISTEEPDYEEALTPLMEDMQTIIQHLEDAGQLNIPGEH